MKKYISLIIGVLAVINIVSGLINNQEVSSIFGMEMNIWMYRGVWILIAAISFTDFVRPAIRVKD